MGQWQPVVATLALIAISVGPSGCGGSAPPAAAAEVTAPAAAAPRQSHAGALNAERLAAAASEPDQWFTTGRDASGAYYSPLGDINASNVARLGFAWDYHLGSHRGLEATPIVIDGVMYATGNFGHVYVLDAASGRELWTYDPQIDGQWGRYACCDAINRGVAVWKGRVYVGALDGYLHAIDAATGQRLWKVDTLPARQHGHRWQRRRGFRRRTRLRRRLRPGQRRLSLALLHRAAQSQGRPAGPAAPG
jgi:quinohemoprotein ethanol dehydrogenase